MAAPCGSSSTSFRTDPKRPPRLQASVPAAESRRAAARCSRPRASRAPTASPAASCARRNTSAQPSPHPTPAVCQINNHDGWLGAHDNDRQQCNHDPKNSRHPTQPVEFTRPGRKLLTSIRTNRSFAERLTSKLFLTEPIRGWTRSFFQSPLSASMHHTHSSIGRRANFPLATTISNSPVGTTVSLRHFIDDERI